MLVELDVNENLIEVFAQDDGSNGDSGSDSGGADDGSNGDYGADTGGNVDDGSN